MKVLVVYANPDPESFGAYLRDRVTATMLARGHRVDLLDLYAEGFDPLVSTDDLDGGRTDPAVAAHAARVRSADALVFVYPTWWSGPPAILKGWLDRVLTDGVAYQVLPSGRVRARLRNVALLVVVTTHGSSKSINVLEGESGKLLFSRTIRLLCRRWVQWRWIAMYGLDASTSTQRETFVGRVERELGKL